MRNSRAEMPTYFTPTAMPMKNCAAWMISAGGRFWTMPLSDRIMVRISGPRIEAPNNPARSASFQPRKPAATMSAIWDAE